MYKSLLLILLLDDAEFVKESWIGENDLLVDSWFASRKLSPEYEVQTVLTVGRKECVPVSRVSTYINPTTGWLSS